MSECCVNREGAIITPHWPYISLSFARMGSAAVRHHFRPAAPQHAGRPSGEQACATISSFNSPPPRSN
ncbi:hypothetical protein DLM_2999 [Aquitalea magnusonii]|uniref:Uncharacterized protein n=1 Tax=Aquitalea magnusonii TaxID=332411 RepID=A0A3G9GIT8_9NEIS|nr:hypothetical protein DLM_2999 [Aquitalea magnusonii]